jgi:putative transposase
MVTFYEEYKMTIDKITNDINNKYYINKTNPGQKMIYPIQDIVEAVLFRLKTGVQWRYLKYNNIKHYTINYHYNKWIKDNIFLKSWKDTLNHYQNDNKYNLNLTDQNIDCTLIKSIYGIENECIGRNPTDRGRNGTKISLLVDKIGVPLSYVIAPANISDTTLFEHTIKERIIVNKKKSILHADKGYSSKKNIKIAKKYNLELSAPNKKNFKVPLFKTTEKENNKFRYVIEACNSWIKGFKLLRLRYDKLKSTFNGNLLLAFICITNKKILKIHK